MNSWQKLQREQARSSTQRGERLLAQAEQRRANWVDGPLTSGQKTFVKRLADRTGLSARVLGSQVLSEMSGTYADQRERDGNHNWLNIGYFDSGPQSLTQDDVWGNPSKAAKASAQFFKGKKYGASPGIRNILTTVGGTDEQQMDAIADSGWASSGYAPTGRLRDTYKLIQDADGSGPLPDEGPKSPRGRVLRRWLQPTESPQQIADQLGVERDAWKMTYKRLDPALQRALVKLARHTGEPVSFNEGFRTRYRQEALAAGTGGATGPAAAPGTSNHEFGNAIDANLTAAQTAALGQFGLSNTVVAGEPWHVELASGGTPQTTAAGRGGMPAGTYGGKTGGGLTALGRAKMLADRFGFSDGASWVSPYMPDPDLPVPEQETPDLFELLAGLMK